MARSALVLFDVDGTLVDSNYLHTVAWSRALREAGEWASMHAIHRLIGMGSDALLDSLLGRNDDDITDGWRREYELLIDEVQPYPEAAGLLADVSQRGIGVVLATSAPAEHLDHMIELLDIADVIDTSTNSDDVDQAKPDPEIFLTAMHRADGSAEHTIVVGDSVWDVESAKAAGLRCIALETGGFSAAELRDAGAIAVYQDVGALRADLDDSPIGSLLGSA